MPLCILCESEIMEQEVLGRTNLYVSLIQRELHRERNIEGGQKETRTHRQSLKVCDVGKLVKLLCSWTLSIVSSKNSSCLYFKTQRPEMGTISFYWTQLSRFYLRMEMNPVSETLSFEI
jgi:hypothetical protein